MLVILIFISQTIFAQAPIPVMPPVKFNDRKLNEPNDDLNLRAACKTTLESSTGKSLDECVNKYKEEKAHFQKNLVNVCSKMIYFALQDQKAKCIETIKNQTMDATYVEACLEKAKGGIDNIKPYLACLKPQPKQAPTGSSGDGGGSGRR